MKRHHLLGLGAIAIVAAMTTCILAQRRDVPVHCERTDSMNLPPAKAPGSEWMRDAYLCTVGEYQVTVPTKPGGHQLMLRRSGQTLAFESGPDSLTLGEPPDLMVFLRDENKDGHFDSISYDTWKGGKWVSVTDWNLDGQPDLRIRELDDESRVQEAWFAGTWKQLDERFRVVGQPNLRLGKDGDGNRSIIDESKR